MLNCLVNFHRITQHASPSFYLIFYLIFLPFLDELKNHGVARQLVSSIDAGKQSQAS